MASGFRAKGGGGGGGGGVLAGDVAGPLLANVIQPGVVTGGGGGKIAANTIDASNIVPNSIGGGQLSADAQPFNNQLTNPGFNFVQLYDATIANVIADNAVGPDAWKVTRETADVTYQRLSNAGLAGYESPNRGRFTKTVAAGKVMVYQPLESLITLAFENQTPTLTINFNLSAINPMRIGFFKYTGGAPNSVVPPPVAAWNGAGVMPTLNAGFTLIGSIVVPSGVGQSAWTVAFGVGALGANDILCAFAVTDNPMAAGDFVDIYQVELDAQGGGRFVWKPLSAVEDIARCERFIEKSYDIDTLPGTVTLVNSRGFMQVGASSLFQLPFRQRKILNGFSAANITLYSPVTGAGGMFADITTAADVGVVATDTGFAATDVASVIAADNDRLKGHWLVNGSL